MQVKIYPSEAHGEISAPPSKSMAHRLLIAAGLAEGESRVRGIADSEDILATMDCLASLGAEVRYDGNDVLVKGTSPLSVREERAVFPCRESGSTLRFFIPLCLLSGKEELLTGSRKLLTRPLSVYEEICGKQGLLFQKGETSLVVKGPLVPGEYQFPGNISSQFVTGLLFALPLLDGDSVLRLIPPVESGSYISMTISALEQFGVRVQKESETEYRIPGGQKYAPRDVTVEGDWSNAAVFLAMGLPVTGLRKDSLQGDRVCETYLRLLESGTPEISLKDCPDLGPVLFAYAALRNGARFTGTRRLAMKESDRGEAMRLELLKFGVDVIIEEDSITVGSGVKAPSEVLDSHNDHRIVMAMSLLCLKTGGTINGAEAVRKSFPDYFERLSEAGIRVEKTGFSENFQTGEF